MITTFPQRTAGATIRAQERRAQMSWWLWFVGLLGVTGLIGLSMLRRGPDPAWIGWFCYLAGIVAILYCPRWGVYLIVGLTLVGDAALLPWYPFVKNFSSAESLLYLNDAFIVSPAETYMILAYVSWLGRAVIRRRLESFYTGPLFWPAVIFIAFITFGLGYGLMKGGDVTIGLWEIRPIYYLPMMLVLASNLLETRAHVNRLIWVALLAIFLDGISGTLFVATVLEFNVSTVDRIAEHSASIHANTFFVLAMAAWMYKTSHAKRITLLVMLPIVAISYFSNQRRAAFITLTIALILIFVVLYWENRKAFWLIAPVVACIGLLYLGAFWNSSGPVALPARAIKSVIAEDAANSRDQSSNLYRLIENINTQFTIKHAPLTGVGFGNKFYIIMPMPDISFFVWWEYIVHNSILWIWMKAGLGAFLSMTFLIGMTLMVGVRTLLRMPRNDMSAIALMATLYIVMHFVFAYVDMSWDAQSMVYVGTMLGLINSLEWIVAKPVQLPTKRWPWQPDPRPASGLRPL